MTTTLGSVDLGQVKNVSWNKTVGVVPISMAGQDEEKTQTFKFEGGVVTIRLSGSKSGTSAEIATFCTGLKNTAVASASSYAFTCSTLGVTSLYCLVNELSLTLSEEAPNETYVTYDLVLMPSDPANSFVLTL